jgi:predicted lysophospholipase L1 biosynthesis ABC-type transport system permease subunit
MATWLLIVIIVVAVLIVVFLIGGIVAVGRRSRATEGRLLADVGAANEQLAQARAVDRGWDRDTIDTAARTAHLASRPGATIAAVHLVQVIDRPGTDDDEAILHIDDDAGEHTLRLGRRGDEWYPRS